MQIDIGLCTFRRPHIAATLHSLAAMTPLPAGHLRVIVADNDDTPLAQPLVEATAAETGLLLTYIHAPARNISIARNACLAAASAPWLAFIDDDELAEPNWLSALAIMLESSGADVVLGPVRAVYPKNCPAWARRGDFHSIAPVNAGGRICTGYTSNVLFRRDAAPFRDLRFREALGRSGGEDTAFFSAACAKGARIVYAPDAWVTEAVTDARLTFGWLVRRRFRAGQTHGRLLRERGAGGFGGIVTAAAKAFLCFAAAAVLLPRWRVWLLRGTLHAGVVARLLGVNEAAHYG